MLFSSISECDSISQYQKRYVSGSIFDNLIKHHLAAIAYLLVVGTLVHIEFAILLPDQLFNQSNLNIVLLTEIFITNLFYFQLSCFLATFL